MKVIAILLSSLFVTCNLLANILSAVPTQTVRGRIINSSNKLPLRSATVQISQLRLGSSSNDIGEFTIGNVPIG